MAKVMVSFPDKLLAEVDAEARRRAKTRSAFLADAARQALTQRDSEEMKAALSRSQERFASAGHFEATELVRADRDSLR